MKTEIEKAERQEALDMLQNTMENARQFFLIMDTGKEIQEYGFGTISEQCDALLSVLANHPALAVLLFGKYQHWVNSGDLKAEPHLENLKIFTAAAMSGGGEGGESMYLSIVEDVEK